MSCSQPTQNPDFYPTLLAAAKIKQPKGIILDGVSTLEAWLDPSHTISRDFLTWHYPLEKPHFLGGVSAGAIRSGPWKLIEHFETGRLQLYALDKDPGETHNLTESEPVIASQLHRKLIDWRTKMGMQSLVK